MQQRLCAQGQPVIMTSPHYNWFLVRSQIFPILESLVVRYMFQLLHHNVQIWIPKEGWAHSGYEPPIIKYLKPKTGDLFTVRFVDCHFDESVYPTLGGEHKSFGKEIDWNSPSLSHLDPRTNQCEQKVQRIIYLFNIANQLPDAFTNLPSAYSSC